MNEVLARFNRLSAEEAAQEILPCCGSTSWARAVAMQRPINDATSLLAVSDEAWRSLEASDWMEAFHSIRGLASANGATGSSSAIGGMVGAGTAERGGRGRVGTASASGGESAVRTPIWSCVHRVRDREGPRPRSWRSWAGACGTTIPPSCGRPRRSSGRSPTSG